MVTLQHLNRGGFQSQSQGIFLGQSGLRTLPCYCSLGHYCGNGLILGLGTSTCHTVGRKRRKSQSGGKWAFLSLWLNGFTVLCQQVLTFSIVLRTPEFSVLCCRTILSGVSTGLVTAFISNYLFKNVYIANSLGRQRC